MIKPFGHTGERVFFIVRIRVIECRMCFEVGLMCSCMGNRVCELKFYFQKSGPPVKQIFIWKPGQRLILISLPLSLSFSLSHTHTHIDIFPLQTKIWSIFVTNTNPYQHATASLNFMIGPVPHTAGLAVLVLKHLRQKVRLGYALLSNIECLNMTFSCI